MKSLRAMSTKSKRKGSSFERDYVKTICRVQRETVGFQPTVTFRNRKRYERARARREPFPSDND